MLGLAAIRWASAFQEAAGLAGTVGAEVRDMELGAVCEGGVADVVDVAAGVEVDPAMLAPQHRGGAGCAARIDEVAEIHRGGDVGVFDEVDAVMAGGDAVCGAGQVAGGDAVPGRREKMAACW